MSKPVIKVEGLSKKFARKLRPSMVYGLTDITRSMIGFPTPSDRLRKHEFWALDDINFELKEGESLGLIGRNGSGKSTLLRLLTGIFPPDKGEVSIRGRLGSLIAVGAGFHPHMTGRENIYLNGIILGLKKREIRKHFEEIVEFAEIGEFIDAPVSTYSSGMTVRLGFSIAVHAIPETLLIDEVLAVGDMKFLQKSMDKIADILDSGTSIILVSHQMLNIQKVCKSCMLLDKGKVLNHGDTPDVISQYYQQCSDEDSLSKEMRKKTIESSHGISYRYIKFMNEQGEETREFRTGDKITVEWAFKMDKPVYDAGAHLGLSTGPQTYNAYFSPYDKYLIKEVNNNTVIRLTIHSATLAPGDYSVGVGLWDERFVRAYFWDYATTGFIRINAGKMIVGRFELAHQWEVVEK